jgi:hypothetical protein
MFWQYSHADGDRWNQLCMESRWSNNGEYLRYTKFDHYLHSYGIKCFELYCNSERDSDSECTTDPNC